MTAGRLRALYYNSATYSSPTWVLLGRISDVNISRARGTGDRKYRSAKTAKKVGGYLEYGITFKYSVKRATIAAPSDTVADKLEDSLINETTLDICALNAVIATGTTRKGYSRPIYVRESAISLKAMRMK